MKNMFDQIPDGWKKKFESGDWLLVVIALLIVCCLLIAYNYGNKSNQTFSDLEKSNKVLTDSVFVLNKRITSRENEIEKRDKQITEKTAELIRIAKIVDSLSVKYRTQKKQNEKSVRNYNILSTDHRIGEFSKLISGEN